MGEKEQIKLTFYTTDPNGGEMIPVTYFGGAIPNVYADEIIPISAEDFGMLAVCAERYSLGRRTYMPGTVCGIIKGHLEQMHLNDLVVLANDIENPLFGDYGDSCDERTWLNMLDILKKEIQRRKAEQNGN